MRTRFGVTADDRVAVTRLQSRRLAGWAGIDSARHRRAWYASQGRHDPHPAAGGGGAGDAAIQLGTRRQGRAAVARSGADHAALPRPVSYTHLTLPTIY